jgi:steroid 5-alpha reductase family enzyme
MNIVCPPKRLAPEGARLPCFSTLYEAKRFLVENSLISDKSIDSRRAHAFRAGTPPPIFRAAAHPRTFAARIAFASPDQSPVLASAVRENVGRLHRAAARPGLKATRNAMMVLVLLADACALCVLMAAAWFAQRRTAQSGWGDTIWSFGVGLVGAGLAMAPIVRGADWPAPRQLLVAALVLTWSLRLGLHIMGRTRQGGEDPRYKALADEWGPDFPRRLFWFLQIQAAAAFPLTLSIFLAGQNPSAFPNPGDCLGSAILIVAISGEAIADRQLKRFAADPDNKGRVCAIGLWGVSRHPNYFFEWLGWLAYPAIAIGWPPGDSVGLIALVGPAFMYWLLVYVSGVPPLEAHMARSRGAAFTAYQRRVNAFFPGPPRKGSPFGRRQNS